MDIDTNKFEIENIESIKPIIIKKYNTVYYCFDTKQAQYIYNSFQQRDFYIKKYNQKKEDFDKIIILYDQKINNLDSMINITNQKCLLKDSLYENKEKELSEIEDAYKNKIKSTKKKIIIGSGVGFLFGLLVGLLL